MHHKNTKPKTFKGHCMMCSAKDTDGTRNGRILTPQEEAAALKTKEGLVEYEEGPEHLYLFQHPLENAVGGYWMASVDDRLYEIWEPKTATSNWCVKVSILGHESFVAHGETLEDAEHSLEKQLRDARHALTRMLETGYGPTREADDES